MRWIVPTAAAAMLIVGGGCAGPEVSRSVLLLRDAREALAQDQTSLAAQRIAEAQRLAIEKGQDTKDSDLLMAELYLRTYGEERALSIAGRVLESEPHDPRTNEVYAKVLLHTGEFERAREHLARARAGYTDGVDTRRVSDLTHLADGLIAYSEGHRRVAEEHWGRIGDPALRRSLERAVRDAE